MARLCLLVLVALFVASCGGTPPPTPDIISTEVAQALAAATFTASAPTGTAKAIPRATAKTIPTTNSTTPATLLYELVDPAQLNCGFSMPEGATLTETMGADGRTHLEGTIGDLICEGKQVKLESNKVVDGFITTKDFGKIRIELSFVTYTAKMYMLAAEREKLERWAKGQ